MLEKKVNNWFDRQKVFFIVSTGRTGTEWLAKLLNQIDGYLVVHEPIPREAKAHRLACENPESIMPYIIFRKKEIYFRCKSYSHLIGYGEVNGNLRRHIIAISKVFPNSTTIHLVRDGRDVIRSALSRKVFTTEHLAYNQTFIQPSSELTAKEWLQLSRFEKCCWSWKEENEFMRKNTSFCARFEDITSSYILFRKQILEPLGLKLDENIWQKAVEDPKNKTKEYTIGPWETWTIEEKEQFIRICGEEMEKYGYRIEE